MAIAVRWRCTSQQWRLLCAGCYGDLTGAVNFGLLQIYGRPPRSMGFLFYHGHRRVIAVGCSPIVGRRASVVGLSFAVALAHLWFGLPGLYGRSPVWVGFLGGYGMGSRDGVLCSIGL